MSTALARALEVWPSQGIPTAPDAWLLTVAKRELLQQARHQRLHNSPQVQAVLLEDEVAADSGAIPDNRLKLLFVCAHPAIDASIRPALMLQAVLGLEAQDIAPAMLTSPSAMAQRLVRAKQKIRDTKIRFEEPNKEDFPERLHSVLEAIYAAYGLGWEAVDGGEATILGLRSEALFLGGLVCQLLPAEGDHAEALGLLALMLFCESRTNARYRKDGSFIPLAEQDTALWDSSAIARAEQLLWQASRLANPGPFQLEAAIQSAHSQRRHGAPTPWSAIVELYAHLLAIAPSLGAQVAQAVAIAKNGSPNEAMKNLLAIKHPRLADYQPFWVAKAHLERQLGQGSDARNSLQRAIGLTSSPATRRYLQARLADE